MHWMHPIVFNATIAAHYVSRCSCSAFYDSGAAVAPSTFGPIGGILRRKKVMRTEYPTDRANCSDTDRKADRIGPNIST